MTDTQNTQTPVATAPGDATPKRGRKPLTDAEKAERKAEREAISNYLTAATASDEQKAKMASLEADIAAAEAKATEAKDVLVQIRAQQKATTLTAKLNKLRAKYDPSTLEEGFVKNVKAFSDRSKIGRETWEARGVSAEVLDRAGF
jgi:outer membrane PBP1 activator LpoA protein